MLEALKSPIMIRNLQIRNRVVMSPVTTRFASESGGSNQATDRLP